MFLIVCTCLTCAWNNKLSDNNYDSIFLFCFDQGVQDITLYIYSTPRNNLSTAFYFCLGDSIAIRSYTLLFSIMRSYLHEGCVYILV